MELNRIPQISLITTRDDDHNHQLVKSIIAIIIENLFCFTMFLSAALLNPQNSPMR